MKKQYINPTIEVITIAHTKDVGNFYRKHEYWIIFRWYGILS